MDITIHNPLIRRPLLSWLAPSRIFDQIFGEHLQESELLPASPTFSPFLMRAPILRMPSWLEAGLSEVIFLLNALCYCCVHTLVGLELETQES